MRTPHGLSWSKPEEKNFSGYFETWVTVKAQSEKEARVKIAAKIAKSLLEDEAEPVIWETAP